MKKYSLLAALAFSALTVTATPKENTSQGNPQEMDKFITELMGKMTLHEKIGQLNLPVNGKRAETGMQVESGDVVVVKGKTVVPEEKKVYLAFNKPRGIVCTAEKREKNNVIDYLSYPVRIYPVGRLDKDSEGLLLMTNDGAIVNGIMRARNRHEKEYQVEVNKEITPEFLKKMASGVPILDTVTRPCRIQKTGERSFTIILTQGLNRQIRRMCEALGYRVTKLKRVRIMNIHLKDLKTGEYRPLTEKELAELKKQIGEEKR